MKTLYYTFCTLTTAVIIALAVYSYQYANRHTLGSFIDEKNAEMVAHKMNDLYGGAYE